MARVCFVSRIRPDQVAAYRRRHAEVWPEMLQALHETGWRDYTLHLAPDGLLVGVVDVDDFDAARDAMALREVNARWQAEMAELFGSDGPPDEGFVPLETVFDLDAQLAAATPPTPTPPTPTPPTPTPPTPTPPTPTPPTPSPPTPAAR
ncbi:L-rhamnose mutarotase [Actinotalea sp. JY-7876]|uniref:L-rhamnose mutarotase n=1 Tax=Actinotalea sp. JY-7876 TaxID=2758442 RepID=UPI0015F6680C